MALPDPSLITGKGTTLKAALEYVEAQWGRAGLERLTAALDASGQGIVTGMVLPSKRYPLPQLVAVFEAVDRVFGRGDLALCWEIGRFAGDYEVKLLHKAFLTVAKLEYRMKMAGVTWGMYYNMGKLRPRIGALEGDMSLTEFNPISKAFCYRFGGWLGKVVELSKFNNVKMTHPKCVLDGHDECRWHGTWTK